LHPLQVVERIARQAALEATDARDRGFYRYLAVVAHRLDRDHHASFETEEITLPTPFNHTPPNLHRDLYSALCVLSPAYRPPRAAMELPILATLGQLRRIVILFNEYRNEWGGWQIRRYLTGVGRNDLPIGVPTSLSNTTTDLDELATMVNRPINTITPLGGVPLVQPVVQIVPKYDVTRERNIYHVVDILRGVLHDLPQYQRVGALCHSTHYEKLIEKLREPYSSRITLLAYFCEGLSRGSNEWITQCDVMIILGTPRPGTPAIRERLVQNGNIQAARLTSEQADWHLEKWIGTTETGESREITTARYRDENWHRAYTNICKAQLKQAIGRGRGILPTGIPVYLISQEDTSRIRTPPAGRVSIAAAPFAPLRQWQLEVLRVLEGTSSAAPLKTSDVAKALHLSTVNRVLMSTNRTLTTLMESGRVRFQRAGGGLRKGRRRRKGWYLAPPSAPSSPTPQSAPAAPSAPASAPSPIATPATPSAPLTAI
jgi:hypothetical protein